MATRNGPKSHGRHRPADCGPITGGTRPGECRSIGSPQERMPMSGNRWSAWLSPTSIFIDGSMSVSEADSDGPRYHGMPPPRRAAKAWSSVHPSTVRPKSASTSFLPCVQAIGTNASGCTCGWTTRATPPSPSPTSAPMWSPWESRGPCGAQPPGEAVRLPIPWPCCPCFPLPCAVGWSTACWGAASRLLWHGVKQSANGVWTGGSVAEARTASSSAHW